MVLIHMKITKLVIRLFFLIKLFSKIKILHVYLGGEDSEFDVKIFIEYQSDFSLKSSPSGIALYLI